MSTDNHHHHHPHHSHSRHHAKKAIQTDQAPAAIGPYSQAVHVGPLLFCSGQIALSANPQTPIPESVKDQTLQVLKNIDEVINAAGFKRDQIVKTTIFLVDMADFQAVNEIYGEYFAGLTPPARSTVAVVGLPKSVKVEIEVTAFEAVTK